MSGNPRIRDGYTVAREWRDDYRDDRDEALLQVRKVMRRVTSRLELDIKAAHDKSHTEGFRVSATPTLREICDLIAEAATEYARERKETAA